MKIQTKKIKEAVLTGDEAEIFHRIVKYIVHRLEYHKESGWVKQQNDETINTILQWNIQLNQEL